MKPLFSSTDPTSFRCTSATLSIFSSQLAIMLSSGVPLLQALEALVDSREDTESMGSLIVPELLRGISSGQQFSSVLSHYPKVFPRTYVALIQASEKSGQMVRMLQEIVIWLDTRTRIERQIKKALIYPCFVVALTGVLTLVMFRTFIPQILTTVLDLKTELPLPTLVLVWLSGLISSPLFWLLALNFLAFAVWYLRKELGQLRIHQVVRHLPILGHLLRSSDTAKYALTLSIQLAAGIDTLSSVKLAALASNSPLFQQDSDRTVRAIMEGDSLAQVLKSSDLYPRLLVDMVAVGEETGKTATLLKQGVVLLEEDLRHRLDVLVQLLEPLILGGLSVLVGGIMVAVMLPISNLISAL